MYMAEAAVAVHREVGNREPEVGGATVVKGRVKWFDPAKGYGFIATGTGPDVMVKSFCLRLAGLETLAEDTMVVCAIKVTPRGLQCMRIVSTERPSAPALAKAFGVAQGSGAARCERADYRQPAVSGWVQASVKWFDCVKGYGFLTMGQGTPDIFVHAETLKHFGMDNLSPEQEVMVRYGQGDNGRLAVDLKPCADGG